MNRHLYQKRKGKDYRRLSRTTNNNPTVFSQVTSPPFWGLRDYGTATWEGGDPDCPHRLNDTPTKRGLASSTLEGSKEHTAAQLQGYKDFCKRCGARRFDLQMGLEATPAEYVERMVRVF